MKDLLQKIRDLENQIDVLNSTLNDSQYLSNIGSWNWNVVSNKVTWTDNMFRLLGLNPNEVEPSYELALHHVHDDDKAKYQEVLNVAIENKTFYYLESRVVKKDNSVISVISRGNCVFDNKGNLIQMYGTVQDVSKQKQIEKLLRERVKIEEADKIKSMFLAIISHDLKYPFLILKNYSKLLVESILLGKVDKAQEFSEIIIETSNESFNIIDNLLEWTRVNARKISYKPEKIYFNDFIDTISKRFSIISEKKNISISICEKSDLEFFADRNVLNIIFTHLIENAIKFSNKKGHVTTSVSINKHFMNFSVSDNGIGMDLEFQEKIFSPDSVVSTIGTNGELGTGIGLKLCKALVERHKGSFSIDSEINVGTTCYFTLPKS